MKTRLLIFALLVGLGLYVLSRMQELPDHLGLPQDLPEHKPFLQLFCTSNCPPCEHQKAVFQEPAVKAKLEGYSVMTCTNHAREDLEKQYQVKAFPTLVVVDPQEPKVVLGKHEGFLDSPSLISWLDLLPTLEASRKKRHPHRPRRPRILGAE